MSIFQKMMARPAVQPISPADLKRRMDSGEELALLDVRSPEEYAAGHIRGSVNLSLDILPARAETAFPDKSATVVVYCLSGGRSAQAATRLSRMGYETVLDMGGINRWPFGAVK